VRDDKERRRLFRSLVAQGHRPALAAAALQMGDEVADDVENDESLDR
jgi:hypothetical protein